MQKTNNNIRERIMDKYLYEEIIKIKRLEEKEPNLDLSKYAVREEETKGENK
tara:strand:- start:757 stop:912 length:156 start_codon:yes stop_codon:yes gene_type:complete